MSVLFVYDLAHLLNLRVFSHLAHFISAGPEHSSMAQLVCVHITSFHLGRGTVAQSTTRHFVAARTATERERRGGEEEDKEEQRRMRGGR